ncbi:MAG: DUF4331 domain-containing protein [Planctomycetota bacterium]|nr:MAG: DUF4331 domain-containing protein [Planctomycetota bacterium]
MPLQRNGLLQLATVGLMVACGAAMAASVPASGPSRAAGLVSRLPSSHNDAPLIKLDPQANLTDVYAFVGQRYDTGEEVLNVVVNVRPFSEPGDGPHFDRFSDDALYSIHITNPVTAETVMRYDFEFSPTTENYKNEGTILSYGLGTEPGPILTLGDARQNFVQVYTVTKTVGGSPATIADGVMTSIPNVGANVTPLYNDSDGRAINGALSYDELDGYTQQAIADASTGEALFAGPRDDSFYGDVPGVFDLLNVRILDNDGDFNDGLGQDGRGKDGFKGFNVMTFAIQIPINELPGMEYIDPFFGPQTGVGVYGSVSRRMTTTRNSGDDIQSTGDWVQVNRLGNPLFNEALVAIADKDRYNATSPVDDAQFSAYASDPELAALINLVFGTAFETTNRADLEAIFIPDVLRVATTTGPVPLEGEVGFSRFGFVGGDTTGGVSSGWPNGRRFGDDVIDIALTAVASGPTYSEITVVGDNVPRNDVDYHRVFPYAATPHSGTFNRKDPPKILKADINDDGVVDTLDILAYFNAWNEER